MIDMQMRAQHRVDRVARETGGGEIGKKRPLEIVPGRDAAALLVVAEAGIDDDAPLRRLDDQRMDAHLEPPALVGEMRLQPADRQHLLIGGLRQDKAAAAGHLQLDDFGDRHVADLPLHRCFLVLPVAGVVAHPVTESGNAPERRTWWRIASARRSTGIRGGRSLWRGRNSRMVVPAPGSLSIVQ